MISFHDAHGFSPPKLAASRPNTNPDRPTPVTVSLVIPGYDEGESIAAVVTEATQVLRSCTDQFEVIVVDDHSSDDTGRLAEAAGARVLRHPSNRGYGNSLKTGILASQYENIIISDADQTYPMEQLPRLLEDAEQYQMIVGARRGGYFQGSLVKRMARFCQLALVRYVTGTWVPDANSGFRLLKRSLAVRYFDFVCSGFSFTTSITIAMLCEQYLVKFVNIDYRKRCGTSRVHFFRDTLRSLQIITQCILRYNPLKAFLLCAVAPWPLIGLFLLLALKSPAMLLGAGLAFCTSLLAFAMGMLAYCVRISGPPSVPVDTGWDATRQWEQRPKSDRDEDQAVGAKHLPRAA